MTSNINQYFTKTKPYILSLPNLYFASPCWMVIALVSCFSAGTYAT